MSTALGWFGLNSGNFETQASVEIHEWVREVLGDREITDANRASSAPNCIRKRWFQNQKIQGAPMQPRSLLVFALGDLVEHSFKYFISQACVGPGKLYSEVDFGEKDGTFTVQHRQFDIYKQEKVFIRMPWGLVIPGHPDGWGKRNSDGRWELIEVKSTASFGFDKFVDGECEYLKQINVLLMSDKAKRLGATEGRFYYQNKNTSAIYDRLYPADLSMQREIISDYRTAAEPLSPPPVPRADGIGPEAETYRKAPTGRFKLGWKCSYCDYNKLCFPNAKLEFKGGKPIYYVRALNE